MANLEVIGSGYRITWDVGIEQRVTCDVRDVQRDGDKAQCAFMLNGQSVCRNYVNLKSVGGTGEITRKLNRLRPKEQYQINWEQIVEDLSGMVIDKIREGVPVVRLSDLEVNESALWRVDNILLQGQPNLIWAEGGAGKSFFGLFLGVLVQEGYSNSEQHGLVVEPGNVLYIDYETDAQEIAKRARMLHKGLGIQPNSPMMYQPSSLSLRNDELHIRDLVHEHNIDMVVIDSMGMAVGGELEDMSTVTSFFSVLRRLSTDFGTTSLVITHSNRSDQIFGSAYTTHWARNIWEARQSGRTATGMDFTMFNRKVNGVPLQPPQSWSVNFEEDAVVYTRGDTFMTDLKGELSYQDLVYRILQDEGAKDKQYLYDTIGAIKPAPPDRITRNIDTILSRYKDKFVKTPEGKFDLVTRVEQNQFPNIGDEEWTPVSQPNGS